MTNPLVHVGDRGPFVEELQRYLNDRLWPSPGLPVDGMFGFNTRDAVLRFQSDNWLTEDGIVGDCTWNALRGTETYTVLHPILLVPQPTPTSCWAASTAMLLGRIGPVSAPAFMLAADGGMLNDSQLNDAAISSQFAQHFGLRLIHGQTWTPDGLARVIERGPVMCNVLWNVGGYLSGAGSSGHMIVLAGIRGDGTGDGTTIRVYNPLPVGRGAVVSVIYGPTLRQVPAMTYQLFQR